MIIAAEAAQLADIAYRYVLQEIFFAQINPQPCNIGMQRHSGIFFKFSGNVLSRYKKFFFKRA